MEKATAHALQSMQARLAALDTEVKSIYEDAERRAAPLKQKASRVRIAVEEFEELERQELETGLLESGWVGPTRKRSTRTLILDELQTPEFVATKLELVDRFRKAGAAVNEGTVGSTLSNLVRDGLLVKDKMNRYGLARSG